MPYHWTQNLRFKSALFDISLGYFQFVPGVLFNVCLFSLRRKSAYPEQIEKMHESRFTFWIATFFSLVASRGWQSVFKISFILARHSSKTLSLYGKVGIFFIQPKIAIDVQRGRRECLAKRRKILQDSRKGVCAAPWVDLRLRTWTFPKVGWRRVSYFRGAISCGEFPPRKSIQARLKFRCAHPRKHPERCSFAPRCVFEKMAATPFPVWKPI